ncbi:hypothetical protein HZS_4300 [Henneguya salminicola]|nr:hypothetical protein HZS_4300 [Henneguya salminicola]
MKPIFGVIFNINHKLSKLNHIKLFSIIRTFWRWLIIDVVFVCLKNCFLITNCTLYGNKLIYYRAQEAKTMSRHAINNLISCNIIEQSNEIVGENFIGKVRHIPKSESVRTIYAFRKLNKDNKTVIILNILKSLIRECSEAKGSSLISFDKLNSTLNDFWERSKQQTSSMNFNFLSADIKNCYDSIDRRDLLNVLEDILPGSCVSCAYTAYNLEKKVTTYFKIPDAYEVQLLPITDRKNI